MYTAKNDQINNCIDFAVLASAGEVKTVHDINKL